MERKNQKKSNWLDISDAKLLTLLYFLYFTVKTRLPPVWGRYAAASVTGSDRI